jgi:hypothetical protein
MIKMKKFKNLFPYIVTTKNIYFMEIINPCYVSRTFYSNDELRNDPHDKHYRFSKNNKKYKKNIFLNTK